MISIVVSSCNINDIEEDSEILVIEKQKTLIENKTALRLSTLNDDEALQNRMQWVSYMTAHVIIHNVEARNQFRYEANNVSPASIIPLKNLIDNPLNTTFKDAFKDVFLYNYYTTSPCTDGGRPRGRPQPVGVIGGVVPDAEFDTLLFNAYVYSLLEHDCFEFYLPNGFFFLESTDTSNPTNNPIFSTAHPLNDSNNNYGFKNFNSCSVEEVEISDSTFGFVLVVRPFRNSTGCLYSDYPGIEFENFLN